MKENPKATLSRIAAVKTKKLCLFLSVISLIIFTSCNKTINGKVYDNFGKPIEGVEVAIQGSDYKTTTNKQGQFSIDYTPGNFVLNFHKEGYRDAIQELSISEKQDYPLEQKELLKLPTEKGSYLFSKELDDYIPLVRQATPKLGDKVRGTTKFYQANQDSTTVIRLSSLADVAILHYNKRPHYLGKVGADGLMGFFSETMLMLPGSVGVNERVKTKAEKVSTLITIHCFTAEYDVDYVYLFDTGKHYLASKNEPYYVFRFEKK
ncbi:carboxypeptidase-like regulatory domain-containing protein [Dysgonomonas massiliensis]|uniref:carboxypeptidase-like regulatory domain-containing protein n=1 Tax=Dysgonomonas massiliensis TaxID=2040292 RepID=UPI000C77BAA8|nr:carboxypeptidase-like regulatory domain-containing protein [Dysgonomonas massiliensis]